MPQEKKTNQEVKARQEGQHKEGDTGNEVFYEAWKLLWLVKLRKKSERLRDGWFIWGQEGKHYSKGMGKSKHKQVEKEWL